MGDKSKIEWTDASWNPVVGCSRVSAGCDNCYAIRQAHRVHAMHGDSSPYAGTTRKRKSGELDWTGVVKVVPERLVQPLRWRRPRRIFVNSMSDLFHPSVRFEDIDRVFAVMAMCPHHTFQVLTKRPERMAEYLAHGYKFLSNNTPFLQAVGYGPNKPGYWTDIQFAIGRADGDPLQWPLPNVWIGTSVENQEAADERIPHLLKCSAAVRFLSCEPLLGPVDLSFETVYEEGIGYFSHGPAIRKIDWVIVGGESGPKARPMHPNWVREIRDQCVSAGVAFHFKQWGEWAPQPGFPAGQKQRSFIVSAKFYDGLNGANMHRVGKHAAGRLLEGHEWNEYPQPVEAQTPVKK